MEGAVTRTREWKATMAAIDEREPSRGMRSDWSRMCRQRERQDEDGRTKMAGAKVSHYASPLLRLALLYRLPDSPPTLLLVLGGCFASPFSASRSLPLSGRQLRWLSLPPSLPSPRPVPRSWLSSLFLPSSPPFLAGTLSASLSLSSSFSFARGLACCSRAWCAKTWPSPRTAVLFPPPLAPPPL
eukprot:scaffold138008_cov31-Tisochrysis_lutea.AAC.12